MKVRALSGIFVCQRVWIGLDTAIRTSSICCINENGQVLDRFVAKTSAADIHADIEARFKKCEITIGIEACSTSVAVARGLRRLGYDVALFDCGQIKRFASIRRSKTDANDARSIADVARLGREVISEVYLKSQRCVNIRAKISTRHRVIQQRKGTEHLIRSHLHLYGTTIGVRVQKSHRLRYHVLARIDEVRNETGDDLAPHILPLLEMAERQREEEARLESEIREFIENEPVCRLFLGVPGVGPITAASFYTAIEDPTRFSRSSDVGAYFGLTPRIHISGATELRGKITKAGNTLTRYHLVQAANAMLHTSKSDSALKAWGLDRSASIGRHKGRIALARKLATVLFCMWRDNAAFEPYPPGAVLEVKTNPLGTLEGRRCFETPSNDVGGESHSVASVVGFEASSHLSAALTEKQRNRDARIQKELELVRRFSDAGIGVAEIVREASLSRSTVYRRLNELKELGLAPA